MVDTVAHVSLLQHYSNPEKDTSIQAVYRFPLLEGVAVYAFEAVIDDKNKIVAKVKEKEEKRKEYEEAVANGKVASLLEQVLPDDQIRFVLPTAIAPRDTKEEDASGVEFTSKDVPLTKDFVLVIESKDLDQPRCFIESHPTAQTSCMMLTLVPRFALNNIPSELVFLVDRSGSMQGSRINQTRQALQLFLRSIYQFLFPGKSVEYKQTNLAHALKHAESMDADLGGTEIHNALKAVFEARRKDMPTQVLLHTLAARKVIQDLEDERSHLHALLKKNPSLLKHPAHTPDSVVKAEIVRFGIEFNLASKYTSFVAIDDKDEKNDGKGEGTNTVKKDLPPTLIQTQMACRPPKPSAQQRARVPKVYYVRANTSTYTHDGHANDWYLHKIILLHFCQHLLELPRA
ncbi:hypothetical protein HK102_009005 [Quaeritorhiza haematococci]|nr:hypothetical protein HK102_009005 [Quaeritorhiza haematococci]